MVKKICIIILLLPIIVQGQEDDKSVLREGLLRAQGTFSFGTLPKLKENGLYLHGNMEYYFDDHFSMRGDIFYHLKSDKFSWLDLNHQLLGGISYHFSSNGNFDPYIGVQPGVALTRSSSIVPIELGFTPTNQTSAITLIYSSVIGFNYYAEDWFHLFVDARMLAGKHHGDYDIDIGEIRLSFGLGFNINSK